MRPCPETVSPDAAEAALGFILAHALREQAAGLGPATALLGLSGAEVAALAARWLPGADLTGIDPSDATRPAPVRDVEQQAIERLVLWRAAGAGPEVRWLAAILARRSMESRHLWEDLGLPARPALTQMIARFLPGLAAANARNMRWKKFFARQICSDAAFALCPAPICDACDERQSCFTTD